MTSGEMREAGKRGPSSRSIGVTVEFMMGLVSIAVVEMIGAAIVECLFEG